MITKIVLTIFIILAALLFVRHKNSRTRQQEVARQAAQAERRTAMFIAIALVSLTLLISAGIYYFHWQEEHQLLNVRVINSHSGKAEQYQVYRSEVEGRSFRTIDGRLISLSANERMEVEEQGVR